MDINNRKKSSYQIFDEIAGTYDLINHLLSFGIDIYWRKKLMRFLPARSELNVLDIATGTGDIAITLAKQASVRHITGIDLSKEMVDIGRDKVKKKKLDAKISLEIGDGIHIPLDDASFDAVTIAFGIRNFDDIQTSLENMVRVLKPRSRALIMEFSLPQNPVVKQGYLFYNRNILPRIGNFISGHNDAYSYLNETIEDFPYGQAFADRMRQAGFDDVSFHPLSFGIATIYCGEKK